jgi:hypothetical protein
MAAGAASAVVAAARSMAAVHSVTAAARHSDIAFLSWSYNINPLALSSKSSFGKYFFQKLRFF